jgi:hypothetical protein
MGLIDPDLVRNVTQRNRIDEVRAADDRGGWLPGLVCSHTEHMAWPGGGVAPRPSGRWRGAAAAPAYVEAGAGEPDGAGVDGGALGGTVGKTIGGWGGIVADGAG